MTKLCDSIDTLAMAYLDDELAEEELRDFELHVVECGECRGRVDGERAALAELRRRLAPPPTPDLLRARLTRALDDEDAAASRAMRRQRVNRWLLPGVASVVAVAALTLFAVARPTGRADAVASEAVRQHMRAVPLEVQGPQTVAWVQRYFRPGAVTPQFSDENVQLAGARLTSFQDRDAAQFFYQLRGGYEVRALTFRAQGLDFSGAQHVRVDNVELLVDEDEGHAVVTVFDDEGYAYVFTSRDLGVQQLVGLVVRTDLVQNVHDRRVGR